MGLQYFERRISIRDAEIFAAGKIAEFAKFAGGERLKFPDLVSDKQTAQWASAALYIQLIPGIDAEDCIKYKT